MQNKTSNSILVFIHGFIIFMALMFVVRGLNTITDIWNTPNEIAIPINFSIEEAGNIKYQNGNAYDFRIRQAAGIVQYYPQNLDKAPMPIYNILIITRMRWIGIGLVGLGILTVIKRYSGLDFLTNHVISDVISFTTLTGDSAYNSGYMFGTFLGVFFRSELVLGFTALFGSEILRYGINLQRESELTI